ncbi:hypothetical protein I4I77_13060, partial [Pseudonocardia sp. KRD-188]
MSRANRPTREEVADALASADIAVGPSMPTLAAEVRALRNELAFARSANEHQAATIAELRENLPRLLAVEAAARHLLVTNSLPAYHALDRDEALER